MSTGYETIIIGAGFSGIAMAVRLIEAGRTSFLICEKADRPGGTWRDNAYPGAACDVPSHLYSLSFAPNPGWTRMYGSQAEILAYIDKIVERWDLGRHLRLGCRIADARWDGNTALWRIETEGGETLTSQFLVGAWGQLNEPQVPEIAGADRFAGISFHSARWQPDVAVAGRRVAVIGNAASAVQIVPEVAKVARHLCVFQRTPNWIVPRLDRPYTDEELDGFLQDPERLQASREGLFREREGRFDRITLDSEKAREFTRIATAHLDAQVPDPDLRRKLTPTYPIGCKRVLVSDDYYPALTRDNVELVTDHVECIEPAGIRTHDGVLHEADVLVYATGFKPLLLQGGVTVTGKNGTLREAWAEGAEAYHGIVVAGFPGLFLLYGPNTNLGHSSVLEMIEAQVAYVLQAVAFSGRQGRGAPDVRPGVMRDHNDNLQRRFATTAWMSNCNSWYKQDGRVTNNWVGNVEEYKAATRAFDDNDFSFVRPARHPSPAEAQPA